jgi:hypothetical protein
MAFRRMVSGKATHGELGRIFKFERHDKNLPYKQSVMLQ